MFTFRAEPKQRVIFSSSGHPKHQGAEEHCDSQDHRQRVELHQAVLDRPEQHRHESRHLGDKVNQAVHEVLI